MFIILKNLQKLPTSNTLNTGRYGLLLKSSVQDFFRKI